MAGLSFTLTGLDAVFVNEPRRLQSLQKLILIGVSLPMVALSNLFGSFCDEESPCLVEELVLGEFDLGPPVETISRMSAKGSRVKNAAVALLGAPFDAAVLCRFLKDVAELEPASRTGVDRVAERLREFTGSLAHYLPEELVVQTLSDAHPDAAAMLVAASMCASLGDALFEALRCSRSLRKLTLDGMNFPTEVQKCIAQGIQRSTSLRTFSMQRSKYLREAMYEFGDAFRMRASDNQICTVGIGRREGADNIEAHFPVALLDGFVLNRCVTVLSLPDTAGAPTPANTYAVLSRLKALLVHNSQLRHLDISGVCVAYTDVSADLEQDVRERWRESRGEDISYQPNAHRIEVEDFARALHANKSLRSLRLNRCGLVTQHVVRLCCALADRGRSVEFECLDVRSNAVDRKVVSMTIRQSLKLQPLAKKVKLDESMP